MFYILMFTNNNFRNIYKDNIVTNEYFLNSNYHFMNKC